jgi:hypothetical protein
VKESGILFELSPGVIRRFRPHVLIGFWGLFCNASGRGASRGAHRRGEAVLKSIVVLDRSLNGKQLQDKEEAKESTSTQHLSLQVLG